MSALLLLLLIVDSFSDVLVSLEMHMKLYPVITLGSEIAFDMNGIEVCFEILELEASHASVRGASTLNSNLVVDFVRPSDIPPTPLFGQPVGLKYIERFLSPG